MNKSANTIIFYVVSIAWVMTAFALVFATPGHLTLTLAAVKLLAILAAVLMLKAWYRTYLILRAKRIINRID